MLKSEKSWEQMNQQFVLGEEALDHLEKNKHSKLLIG